MFWNLHLRSAPLAVVIAPDVHHLAVGAEELFPACCCCGVVVRKCGGDMEDCDHKCIAAVHRVAGVAVVRPRKDWGSNYEFICEIMDRDSGGANF